LAMCYFVFFFQAEDGIRDRNVTGVQTCALPISSYGEYDIQIEVRDGNGNLVGVCNDYVDGSISFNADASDVEASSFQVPWSSPRSEERRVGKECRYGWVESHVIRQYRSYNIG